jgi:hypothetical protein
VTRGDAEEALARFGARCLAEFTEGWDIGDLDGGSVWEHAIATGVIVERKEKHPPGECEACAEFDAPCCEVPNEVLRVMGGRPA